MDISASLSITAKGEDEVRRRIYKLGMKKRSVLILLEKPQTIRYILAKSLFPPAEVIEEIRGLIADQFVAVGAAVASTTATSGPESSLHLDSGIIISEAKYLLNDFCVDNFGTQAQAFVTEISACGKEQDLGICLAKLVAAAQKQCPDRLPLLVDLVRAINDTA